MTIGQDGERKTSTDKARHTALGWLRHVIIIILILRSDTKSIVQAHTACKTQVDKNKTFYNGIGGRATGLQTNS